MIAKTQNFTYHVPFFISKGSLQDLTLKLIIILIKIFISSSI